MIIFSFGKNTTGRNINVKPYPEILCWKRCPEFSSQPYIIYNLLNILMFILDPPPYLSVKPVSMLYSPIPLQPAHCWERYPGFPHWLPLAQVEAASICSCPQTPSTDINMLYNVQCTSHWREIHEDGDIVWSLWKLPKGIFKSPSLNLNHD